MDKLPSSKKMMAKTNPNELNEEWKSRKRTLRNDWSRIDPYVVLSQFELQDYKLEYELSQHCINYWIYLINDPRYRYLIQKEDIIKACQMGNISLNELHDYYLECSHNLATSRGYAYYQWSRKSGHNLDELFKIAPVHIPTADEIEGNFVKVCDKLLRLYVSRVIRRDNMPTGIEEAYREELLLDYYDELKKTWNQDYYDELFKTKSNHNYPIYSGSPFEWLYNPDNCMYFSDLIRECNHYNLDFNIFRCICIAKLNEHNRNSAYAKPVDFDETFSPANEKKIKNSLFLVF